MSGGFMSGKPKIVLVKEKALQEREPPSEKDYEFLKKFGIEKRQNIQRKN